MEEQVADDVSHLFGLGRPTVQYARYDRSRGAARAKVSAAAHAAADAARPHRACHAAEEERSRSVQRGRLCGWVSGGRWRWRSRVATGADVYRPYMPFRLRPMLKPSASSLRLWNGTRFGPQGSASQDATSIKEVQQVVDSTHAKTKKQMRAELVRPARLQRLREWAWRVGVSVEGARRAGVAGRGQPLLPHDPSDSEERSLVSCLEDPLACGSDNVWPVRAAAERLKRRLVAR
eukprot:scaffold443_cov527-Prasinococcus_capsulatus_cf.AAC.26